MNPVERTARKWYICNFCELPIDKGTRYVYERLTPWDHPDDEGYGTWRAHLECREFWESIDHEYDEYYPGDASAFREEMAEAKTRVAIAAHDAKGEKK